MSVTDTYKPLKTAEKDEMFTELFRLKASKKAIDKQIKEIEAQYKGDIDGIEKDLFYELRNGIKFSIRHSFRKGSIDTKAMEESGIDVESFRKKSTLIHTLREDK